MVPNLGTIVCYPAAMSTDLDDRALGLLRSQPSWTAAALAHALGVSLRTVRRVLARLAQTGVPLDSEPGRGGGVRLSGAVGLPRLRLDHREVLDLLLALAVAESLDSPLLLHNLRGLRQKLGMVLPQEQRHAVASLRKRILVGQPAQTTVVNTLSTRRVATVAPVQDAFLAQLCLNLTYMDGVGVLSQRTVEPHYLLLNHPVWYVLAFDLGKQAGRCFRLDRIQDASVAKDHFRLKPAAALMAEVGVYFNEV